MSNIYNALVAIMGDISAISKDKQNRQQGFSFRGIDDVYNSIHPLLSKHGVFCLPESLGKEVTERKTAKGGTLIYTHVKMKYTFVAADGSSVFCVVEGEGMDSGDKSTNKAMAIAHKYALFQTFCIPTEEVAKDDPDLETHTLRNDQDDQPKPRNIKPFKITKAQAIARVRKVQNGVALKALAAELSPQCSAHISKEDKAEVEREINAKLHEFRIASTEARK